MLTRKVLSVTFLGALISIGCVDPEGRFAEFEERVPDAGVDTTPDAMPLDTIPDISGSFLVAVAPTVAPNITVQLYWETELTPKDNGMHKLDVRSIAISTDANGRMQVGAMTEVLDVEVSRAGEFKVNFDGLVLPGTANALTGAELKLNAHFEGVIKSADEFCGVLGQGSAVLSPMVDVTGSTFGSVRVEAGAQGAALPPPQATCKAAPAGEPDAGLPDANDNGSGS